MVTQETLKSLLSYDPETGIFTWLVKRNGFGGGVYPGDIAGGDNNHGYIVIGVCGKRYMASRLAYLYMTGSFPDGDVDHINGDTKDNRFCNLRSVSHQNNMRNMKLNSQNKTGKMGVRLDEKSGRYHAAIHVNYKKMHIGSYATLDEAVKARADAEHKYGFHKNHGRAA